MKLKCYIRIEVCRFLFCFLQLRFLEKLAVTRYAVSVQNRDSE